jgi:hypothetical protein
LKTHASQKHRPPPSLHHNHFWTTPNCLNAQFTQIN